MLDISTYVYLLEYTVLIIYLQDVDHSIIRGFEKLPWITVINVKS